MRRTDNRRLATQLFVCGLFSAVFFCGAAKASTVGTLAQLTAPNGCMVDASMPVAGCASGRALLGTAPFFGSHAVALSPDGENLYAASFNSDAISVFNRNSTTGALTQKPGPAGCVANTPLAGCATGHGLVKPTSIAVTADGKSVYAASIVRGSVTVFDRSTKTGSLKQKSGGAGCIANDPGPECSPGRALAGADVVVASPDGHNVYVGSFESDAVAVFDRSRSGALVQKANAAGCFILTATAGCTTARGLKGAEGMTVSPDGKSVYVGAAVGNAVAVFRRNRSNGNLSQAAGTAGCAAFMAGEGCASADGVVGADAMQVSADNKSLYVAAGVGSTIAIFKRNPRTGRIGQLPGEAGCFTDRTRDLKRCTTAAQLDGPEGIAVSSDGDTVYVGSFFSSAVAVFDRDSFTGALVQRAGANGCIVNVATSGCTTGTALGRANALAISPDGRSVYVGAYAGNAIAVFTRARPRSGHVSVAVPSRISAPSGVMLSLPVNCSGTSSMRCPGGISLTAASMSNVGRGSFNVPSGQRRTVPIKLSASARRYLRTHQSLAVTATMRVVEPSGEIKVSRQRIVLLVSGLG